MTEQFLELIANIQAYSVNDGPGIRTTVFMKGCPLRCLWCHNPEMISSDKEVWYNSGLCISCGKCIEVCSESAIKGYKDNRVIDRDACTDCMKCAEVCPTGAMSAVGQRITVEDVLKEIRRDEIFYRRNEGGVTISGGEPLLQARFVAELLKECQTHLIHTALDTCGYASWDTLVEVARHTDLTLFDIKHMNPVKHKWGTGVSNELILDNARKLAKVAKMRIRIPIIPEFNDSEEQLREMAKFMVSNNLQDVDLLPYHTYAEGKYKMLIMKYEFEQTQAPAEERMQSFKAMFESYGLRVTIGG